MKLIHLEQRSKAWLDWRRNKIMASDAPILTGVSPYKTIDQLYNEKIYGYESVCTPWMQRGIDLESKALESFEKETGLILFPCIGEHENGWMGASFDGMTIEGDALVEIKCSGKKDHNAAILGAIANKYIPQLQHQLFVADLQEMFFFSFDGEKGVIIEVKRDQGFIDNLVEKEFDFWQRLQQKQREKDETTRTFSQIS